MFPDSDCANVVQLTDQVIDHWRLLEEMRSPGCGAVVLFLGTVRELTEGRVSVALSYEAFGPMAEHELRRLVDQAQQQFEIPRLGVVHRVGRLELGEVAVAIAAASPHRRAAFEATSWLMDRIKETVPIWKKEHWNDGESAWIHPVVSEQDHS